jgi:hypothetical protein
VTAGALAPHELLEKARGYAADAKAPRTRREYRRAWDSFVAWCDVQGRTPLPALPDTVALYLAARAEAHTVATVEQDLNAISAFGPKRWAFFIGGQLIVLRRLTFLPRLDSRNGRSAVPG